MNLERHILVVDDDEHARSLLKDLCEATGFKVSVAADGQECLDQLHTVQPDLVLLDLMMPKRDGFSVLKAVRETPNLVDLPIIVLTAMGDIDGKIRGMELGADDYVTKPFKLVELQTRINSALLVRDYRKRLLAAEEELAQFRALDPLTGAGTYSQLKASLDSELARSRRYGRPAAALYLGFDDLSVVRHHLGRDATDTLISSVASAIRGSLRGADRFFRVDSDEFVVLLPETGWEGAKVAGTRLLQVVLQQTDQAALEGLATKPKSGEPLKLQTRCGAAVFPAAMIRTSEDLLREANKSYRNLISSNGTMFTAPKPS